MVIYDVNDCLRPFPRGRRPAVMPLTARGCQRTRHVLPVPVVEYTRERIGGCTERDYRPCETAAARCPGGGRPLAAGACRRRVAARRAGRLPGLPCLLYTSPS